MPTPECRPSSFRTTADSPVALRLAMPTATWVVITLWYDTECADASAALAESHPATTAFDSLIDPASVLMERYQTLD